MIIRYNRYNAHTNNCRIGTMQLFLSDQIVQINTLSPYLRLQIQNYEQDNPFLLLLLYRAFFITFKILSHVHTPHSTQYTHYNLKHILLQHSNIFNDVILLIIPQIL
jgi:hypothetical protein